MIHFFTCDKCNVTITDDQAMTIHICPSCGDDMRWDLDGLSVNDNNNERWSRSMGVPASQVEEARKAYPGSVYNDKGDLLIKNRKHKLKEAERRNMVELDNIKEGDRE